MKLKCPTTGLALALALSGCATIAPPAQVSAPAALSTTNIAPAAPAHMLKRKIAIGRFTNDTLYGKALLVPGETDPLGRQTADMMATALGDTGQFVVLERNDIGLVEAEQRLSGVRGNIVGADDLLVGGLTQFGRETEGEDGFLSNTKKQIAYAKIEVRLVDVKTAQVIFTATGTGQAEVQNGTVAGFGNEADYDETLNDRAIGAAINDVMNSVVEKLDEKPWRTDILRADGDTVYISGGAQQGLTPGTKLAVMRAGDVVKSAQSGFDISLPPQKIASLSVTSNFGAGAENEGSICNLTSGDLPEDTKNVFVVADEAP